jgi:lipid-A-disaccharide synthase
MREAGVALFGDISRLGIMGFTALFKKGIILWRIFGEAVRKLREERPNLLVLIDFPDFNLLLARRAKRLNIPVLYYISPQIWAWRGKRIKTIRKRVDRMCVILPFEERLYREAGVPVTFVGHPLLDIVPKIRESGDVMPQGGEETVALLPGSRRSEMDEMLPRLLGAAEIILKEKGKIRFLLPLAPTLDSGEIASRIPPDFPLKIITGGTYQALKACQAAVVASGTATLEAAILKVPMVVVYHASRVNFFLARLLVRVPYISLVNLVAENRVVPELIQKEASPERIAREVLNLLNDPEERSRQCAALRTVYQRLGQPGASRRVAQAALSMISHG